MDGGGDASVKRDAGCAVQGHEVRGRDHLRRPERKVEAGGPAKVGRATDPGRAEQVAVAAGWQVAEDHVEEEILARAKRVTVHAERFKSAYVGAVHGGEYVRGL